MKKFRVVINCENYIVDLDDELTQMGFYTTRLVEARDENEAIMLAFDKLKAEKKFLIGMRNLEDDPPRLEIEEIEEVESFQGIEKAGTGFTFYQEEIDEPN